MFSTDIFLQSWVVTYANVFLTIGLGALALMFTAWVGSKIYKFVQSERKQYQPYFFFDLLHTIFSSGIITSVLSSLITQWWSPKHEAQVQPQSCSSDHKDIFDRFEKLESLIKELAGSRSSPIPTESCSSPCVTSSISTECKNPCDIVVESKLTEKESDVLNSIIRGSVDISNLDSEIKDQLVSSFTKIIKGLDHVNGLVVVHNNELEAILDRIGHSIQSIAKTEISKTTESDIRERLDKYKDFVPRAYVSVKDVPIGAIHDMITCFMTRPTGSKTSCKVYSV